MRRKDYHLLNAIAAGDSDQGVCPSRDPLYYAGKVTLSRRADSRIHTVM